MLFYYFSFTFLDDNDAKDMTYMKLTEEVIQMNGQVRRTYSSQVIPSVSPET